MVTEIHPRHQILYPNKNPKALVLGQGLFFCQKYGNML